MRNESANAYMLRVVRVKLSLCLQTIVLKMYYGVIISGAILTHIVHNSSPPPKSEARAVFWGSERERARESDIYCLPLCTLHLFALFKSLIYASSLFTICAVHIFYS